MMLAFPFVLLALMFLLRYVGVQDYIGHLIAK